MLEFAIMLGRASSMGHIPIMGNSLIGLRIIFLARWVHLGGETLLKTGVTGKVVVTKRGTSCFLDNRVKKTKLCV